MTTKEQIINHMIQVKDYSSYLEIGIHAGHCFMQIACDNKTGVDPSPQYTSPNIFVMTSDEYFNTIPEDDKYDLIFIDGLHLEEQVDRDIKNSLDHISDSGLIVLHDCCPVTVHDIREDYYDFTTPSKTHWNGTVYKSLIKLRYTNSNIEVYTVDTDEGCGIINPRGKQELYTNEIFSCEDVLDDFDLFCLYKKDLLNLISFEEFKNMELV